MSTDTAPDADAVDGAPVPPAAPRRRTAGDVVRGVVGVLGELLITAGVVVLLFLVWQLWWTDVVSGREQQREASSLVQQWDAAPKPTTSGPAIVEKKVAYGTPFAIIRIPRFGKDYARPIIQGVTLSVLDKGVGHYPDSAQPGQVGNFAVAGHRVTYAKPFNRIAELKPGDPIVVETQQAWYVYRVGSHRVVTPDHVEVVAPVPNHPGRAPVGRWMTMTACHPEYSARQRYVVFSQLQQVLPKSGGVRPSVLDG